MRRLQRFACIVLLVSAFERLGISRICPVNAVEWNVETGEALPGCQFLRRGNSVGTPVENAQLYAGSPSHSKGAAAHFYAVSRGEKIELWSIGDSGTKLIATMTGHTAPVHSLALSRDQRVLASGGADRKLILWDAITGRLLRTVAASGKINALAFSLNGRHLASADRSISIRDASTGDVIHVLPGHSDEISVLIFLPDGKTLLSASWDRTIRLWDYQAAKQLAVITVADGIDAAAVNPAGSRIATAHVDGTVELWDAALKHLRTLDTRAQFVDTLSFSPDGRSLLGAALWEHGDALYLLHVGIDKYGAGIPSLKFAVADAKALEEALHDAGRGLFHRIQSWTLGNASRAAIEQTIDTISRKARPSDTFVFHFAGNGNSDSLVQDASGMRGVTVPRPTAENNEAMQEGVRREFFLVPADVKSVADIRTAGISATQLKTWLARIAAQRVLVVFDTGDASRAFDAFASEVAGDSRMNRLLDRKMVFFSPQGDSFENPKISHGALTYGLLQALNASNVTGEDGLFTVRDLEGAAYREVLKACLGKCRLHTLTVGEDFPIARFAAPVVRGVSRAPEEPPKPASVLKGKYYALLIGTDRYDDKQWSTLTNPTFDVDAIAEELSGHYRFVIDKLKNPTIDEICNKLSEYLEKKKFEDDDELLIFLAGHGMYKESLNAGYLAASDSKFNDPLNRTYLSHPDLYRIVNRIPCKHIFLVIDACFGGTFEQTIGKQRGQNDLVYDGASKLEIITRKKDLKTRLFLTSGGKEYVPDGRVGANSPFVFQLLRALRTYGGSDGILTLNDLVPFVEQVKPNQPRYNWFGDADPSSDFWFVAQK